MKYRCQTQGCSKFGIAYEATDANLTWMDMHPNDELACSLCEGAVLLFHDPEPTPEPESAPQDVEDLGPHIRELALDPGVRNDLTGLYDNINDSASFHPGQVRVIMRELVQAYLWQREQNDHP